MAQGYYGTASNPLSGLYSERVVFTGRTSDPANTEDGDWWLRTDVSEFRFDHGSGVWQIPVFPRGGSGSGVEEVLPVHEDLEASVSRDADSSDNAFSDRRGLAIETHGEIDGLTATVSSITPAPTSNGPSMAYLHESDGTELESVPISGGEASFTSTLDANTEYQVVGDDDGSTFEYGINGSPSFPYTGNHIDIIGGISNSQRDDLSARVFSTVETTIEEGFVPVIEGTAGAFAQLGFQHDGARYGLHDSLSATPDSGDLHARFDPTELSLSDGQTVSTWGDETGNGHDLTAGTAPTYKTGIINGNPVVRFDGVNDFLTASFSTLPQPNHIFAVLQVQASSADDPLIDSADSNNRQLILTGDSEEWELFGGTVFESGLSQDSDAHIVGALFNGTSSEIRVDGTGSGTGDAGSDGMGGLTVGSTESQNNFGEVDVGEILVYPQDKSGIAADVEAYLSDKWGIAV